MSLRDSIRELLNEREVRKIVESRIREFELVHSMGEDRWFEELCFCLLTANFSAEKALRIWEEGVRSRIFLKGKRRDLEEFLREGGHRFYRKRAEYIVNAREKLLGRLRRKIISLGSEFTAREWLVSEIAGIGMKEASHFLRNVGYKNIAIIDRHVLRACFDDGIIEPFRSLTRRRYLLVEERLRNLALDLGITLAELDLYIWYLRTGRILK